MALIVDVGANKTQCNATADHVCQNLNNELGGCPQFDVEQLSVPEPNAICAVLNNNNGTIVRKVSYNCARTEMSWFECGNDTMCQNCTTNATSAFKDWPAIVSFGNETSCHEGNSPTPSGVGKLFNIPFSSRRRGCRSAEDGSNSTEDDEDLIYFMVKTVVSGDTNLSAVQLAELHDASCGNYVGEDDDDDDDDDSGRTDWVLPVVIVTSVVGGLLLVFGVYYLVKTMNKTPPPSKPQPRSGHLKSNQKVQSRKDLRAI